MARSDLDDAFDGLRADLVRADGPQISTMRNYRYALLQYLPEQEFAAREYVQRLVGDLKASGWVVLTVSLQRLLLARVRNLGDVAVRRLIEIERRTAQTSLERSLNHLKVRLEQLVEGPEGIAADISREIITFADRHPAQVDRMVVLVGRAGALYPFARIEPDRDYRPRIYPARAAP